MRRFGLFVALSLATRLNTTLRENFCTTSWKVWVPLVG